MLNFGSSFNAVTQGLNSMEGIKYHSYTSTADRTKHIVAEGLPLFDCELIKQHIINLNYRCEQVTTMKSKATDFFYILYHA